MSEDLHIEPLRSLHMPACLALWDAEEMMPEPDREQRLRRLLKREPVLSRVALVDSAVGGVVLCSQDEFSASIFRLVVSRSLRNRGIGTRLMRAAEEAAAAAGITRMILITRDPIAAWCERQGYMRTPAAFLFKVLR